MHGKRSAGSVMEYQEPPIKFSIAPCEPLNVPLMILLLNAVQRTDPAALQRDVHLRGHDAAHLRERDLPSGDGQPHRAAGTQRHRQVHLPERAELHAGAAGGRDLPPPQPQDRLLSAAPRGRAGERAHPASAHAETGASREGAGAASLAGLVRHYRSVGSAADRNAVRRAEVARGVRDDLVQAAAHSAAGRADEPSGHGHDRSAGDDAEGVQWGNRGGDARPGRGARRRVRRSIWWRRCAMRCT